MRQPYTAAMARRFRFRQVDVFTDTQLCGNPLAVFLGADHAQDGGPGLTDDEMQALARETNLSETAFAVEPTAAGVRAGAAFRLRIFTPRTELPFAGHPTIGAAWVVADEGAAVERLVAELPDGPVELHVARGADGRAGDVTLIRPGAEILQRLDEDELAELCEALEVPENEIGWRSGGRRRKARPMVISTGLPHLIVPFVDRAVLLDVEHERRLEVTEICRSLGVDSAVLLAAGNSGAIADADVCVRMFDAVSLGIDADPATGAAAGPVCVYLGMLVPTRGATHRVTIEQGTEVGRPSRLRAAADFDAEGIVTEVRVTGSVVPVSEGWVTLD
jgi:trans-2,3-dihydro-3-hydroxyanthranilate isomerase